jgi:NAD(P)-dependent dehydrogenase (short-subunit alcohol dehydrogenase family)
VTSIDGRTALVNGGGTGIGRGIAIALGSNGARVVSNLYALLLACCSFGLNRKPSCLG